MMKKFRALHFMHIPKTAGSSLWTFIDFQFKQQTICPSFFLHNKPPIEWFKPEHVFRNVMKQASTYHFFRGHLGWSPRQFIPLNDIETITFLRHPIEHMLSIYGHICRDKDAFPTLSQRFNSFDHFDDFIFDRDLQPYLSNIQSQHFCTDKHFIKKPSNIAIEELVGIWVFDFLISPAEMHQLAIERLYNCAFVGITEHYEESLNQLCFNYAWLPPKKIPMINISPNRIQKTNLSAKALERIIELNQIDFALYKEGLKIFKDKSRRLIAFNHAKLEKNICDNLPQLKKVFFHFKNKIVGEGWHNRENYNSETFCWSSEKVSTLFFSIQSKENLFISFHITHSLLFDFQNKLSLTVNGNDIPLRWRSHPKKEGFIFEGIIQRNIFQLDSTLLKLAFFLPQLICPHDIDPFNPVTRLLGFACQSIKIIPISKLKKRTHQTCEDRLNLINSQ